MVAVEQAVDRPQRDADENRLRGAVQEVVEPVLAVSTIPIAASRPAKAPSHPPPASRLVSRQVAHSASRPPTRAVITHSVGAALPNRP